MAKNGSPMMTDQPARDAMEQDRVREIEAWYDAACEDGYDDLTTALDHVRWLLDERARLRGALVRAVDELCAGASALFRQKAILGQDRDWLLAQAHKLDAALAPRPATRESCSRCGFPAGEHQTDPERGTPICPSVCKICGGRPCQPWCSFSGSGVAPPKDASSPPAG